MIKTKKKLETTYTSVLIMFNQDYMLIMFKHLTKLENTEIYEISMTTKLNMNS